jgi:glutamine cyclotransferase
MTRGLDISDSFREKVMKKKILSLVPKKRQAAALLLLSLCIALGAAAVGAEKTLRPRVLQSFPHDKDAFTQGLTFHNGTFIESTGRRGFSVLRRVEPETGTVLQEYRLHPLMFGEGSTIIGDRIYMLTWTAGVALVFDAETLKPLRRMRYKGQGWGLTSNGTHLVMSDGGSTLMFRDPKTFRVIRRLAVMDDHEPLQKINELEWIDGRIFANIWQSNDIVIINSESGKVVKRLDISGIMPKQPWFNSDTVPNGIAWDAEKRRLFITGKLWPKLFEIEMPD